MNRGRGSCACEAPRGRPKVYIPRESSRAPFRIREQRIVASRRSESICRPFLKVEKDAERFAVCNALADEIGPLDDPKKVARLIGEWLTGEPNEVFGVLTVD